MVTQSTRCYCPLTPLRVSSVDNRELHCLLQCMGVAQGNTRKLTTFEVHEELKTSSSSSFMLLNSFGEQKPPHFCVNTAARDSSVPEIAKIERRRSMLPVPRPGGSGTPRTQHSGLELSWLARLWQLFSSARSSPLLTGRLSQAI